MQRKSQFHEKHFRFVQSLQFQNSVSESVVADKEYAKSKMLNYGLAKRFIKWFSHRVNVDQCEFAIVAMLLCAKLMYHNHILI